MTRRTRATIAPADTLGIRLDPQLVHEFATWAQKAGVSRSALARMEIEAALRRYRKHGRTWLKRQVSAYSTREEGGAPAGDGAAAGNGRSVAGPEGPSTQTDV